MDLLQRHPESLSDCLLAFTSTTLTVRNYPVGNKCSKRKLMGIPSSAVVGTHIAWHALGLVLRVYKARADAGAKQIEYPQQTMG